MKKLIVIALLLAAAGGGGYWYWKRGASAPVQYRVEKLKKGDLLVAVTATGAIQPVNQVQVGTQVSGTIQRLGADFNSKVTTETVLAQIDPAPFQARVDQDRANLTKSEADVDRVQASLTQAESELKRAVDMAKQQLISDSEMEAAQATRDGLVAQMKVARATIEQSKASLRVSEVNLQYTTIKSPIDGIVIARSVDVGQTVAASLATPTLFVIADGLKKILVQASVAEADIGKIFPKQKATFTVDAFRGRPFDAEVTQVRLQPTTVQNVVTYTVVLAAENPDEKLLPGMTANVSFEVERAKDVLRVPNSALRFNPNPDAPPEAPKNPRDKSARVWVQGANGPTAVSIETGSTDGSYTAVTKGDLQPDQEIIVGLSTGAKDSGMSNPFAPSYGGGGRPGGGGGAGGRGGR